MADSKPPEQPAVRTTIVGGRPPGSGQPCREVLRGIEVLIKKAAVDRAFAALLLKERDAAADAIGLTLSRSEIAMLQSIPDEQLAAMVRQTDVRPELLPVFQGAVAAVMLAALSAAGSARGEEGPPKSDPPEPSVKEREPKPARPAGEPTPRRICKVFPPRMMEVAGIPPPGWDQPRWEWVEVPPESTPELDKLTPEQVQARVKELVAKLADEDFEVREGATLRLMQLGQRVLPLIVDLKPDDADVASRLGRTRRALETAKKAEGHLQMRNGRWEWHVER